MKGRVLSAACALYALAACSSEGGDPFVIPSGQQLPDGGYPSVTRDSGLDAGEEKGPAVTITSPAPVLDPLSGSVLAGASADVRCEVKQRPGGGPVDPNKVSIAVYPANSAVPAAKVDATLRGTDTFGATVPLTSLPTGRIRFECTALDTAAVMAQQSTARIETFYDGGPTITFTNLNENSILRRGNSTAVDVAIQFKVNPAMLAPVDPAAEIGDVKLLINDMEVALGAPVDGEYKKEIDFFELFKQAPIQSFTVAVRASNKRSPAAIAQKQMVIRVDGDGPDIKVTSPAEFSIVGGTVTVRMEITDALAGVSEAANELYAVMINNERRVEHYAITRDAPGGKDYRYTFEASRFPDMRTIVAQIHAKDVAGNESQKEHPLRLDTVPPFVSLDPGRWYDEEGNRCGVFDPLGDSPKDGAVIYQEARFRALVWERGIRVLGQTEYYFSGVRDDSVVLYTQEDPAVALLIDTDGNGTCDSVNNAQALGTKAPYSQPMKPLAPGGTLPGVVAGAVGTAGRCSVAADATVLARCDSSEMYWVARHNAKTATNQPIPVIYGFGPTTPPALGCTGTSGDIGGHAGWACVAVAARDQTSGGGYLGVSKPIRVCRWLKEGDCGGRAPYTVVPPEEIPSNFRCTDGCTLPATWTTLGTLENR